jgi:hypothetical protein
MKKIALPIILLILFSCNGNTHWTKFNANGIPDQGESYKDIVFINDSVGYLGGSKVTLLNEPGHDSTESNAVLYKTIDKGKTWKQIPINVQGGIEKIFAFKDALIVLFQDVTAKKNYILRLFDNGKVWNKLFEYDQNNYVRAILFKNAESGIIEIENKLAKNQYLLSYNSSMSKWDTIKVIQDNYNQHKIGKDCLFSLIPTDTISADSKGVLITSIKNKTSQILSFDKPYYVSCSATDDDQDYWIAVNDNHNNNKMFKVSNGKLEIIQFGSFSNYEPSAIFVYNRTIITIVNHKEDVAFLGVIHEDLISTDNGKTWVKEDLPGSLIVKPACMYKDKFFITVSSPGFFQLRNQ